MITYKGTFEKERMMKVYLDNKHIGHILSPSGKTYQYVPKGYDTTQGGEKFLSLEECKNSLESP